MPKINSTQLGKALDSAKSEYIKTLPFRARLTATLTAEPAERIKLLNLIKTVDAKDNSFDVISFLMDKDNLKDPIVKKFAENLYSSKVINEKFVNFLWHTNNFDDSRVKQICESNRKETHNNDLYQIFSILKEAAPSLFNEQNSQATFDAVMAAFGKPNKDLLTKEALKLLKLLNVKEIIMLPHASIFSHVINVAKNSDCEELINMQRAVKLLQFSKIASKDNLELVLNNKNNATSLAMAINWLEQEGLNNPQNRKLIESASIENATSLSLAMAIDWLEQEGLNNLQNRKLIERASIEAEAAGKGINLIQEITEICVRSKDKKHVPKDVTKVLQFKDEIALRKASPAKEHKQSGPDKFSKEREVIVMDDDFLSELTNSGVKYGGYGPR